MASDTETIIFRCNRCSESFKDVGDLLVHRRELRNVEGHMDWMMEFVNRRWDLTE